MEEPTPTPSPADFRKVTTKQVVGFGALALAIPVLQWMSQTYLTNDKAEAIRVELASVKISQISLEAKMTSGNAELVRKIERGNDFIIQAIKETEVRTAHNQDRMERRQDHTDSRLDTLEASMNNRSNRRTN